MQVQQISDGNLVKNYVCGDEKSLEKLILRHKQKIFGFVYSKVMDKHVAEDIFQDTFIKVINTLKRGKYNEEGKFLPWVMRISHNLVIDHYRKSKRIPKFNRTDDFDIFTVLGDRVDNMESKMVQIQTHNQIKEVVKCLPKNQKDVLMMRIYDELSFKEIAENTGVSINTVLGRMRYALINIRKSVKKNQIILTD